MSAVQAIAAIRTLADQTTVGTVTPQSEMMSFARLLETGVDQVNKKLINAEALSKAFAVDDSIPVQQVTLALQEARLSLEFMLQARTRLVEAYQQFAQMQL